MCKHVQMFPHTVEELLEKKSLFHELQRVCCSKSVAQLRAVDPDLCKPAMDEDEVSFAYAAGRAPKSWTYTESFKD